MCIVYLISTVCISLEQILTFGLLSWPSYTVAWALAQIVTTVPANIEAYDRTEVYTNYYDIMVKHAFGNYRDILAE